MEEFKIEDGQNKIFPFVYPPQSLGNPFEGLNYAELHCLYKQICLLKINGFETLEYEFGGGIFDEYDIDLFMESLTKLL